MTKLTIQYLPESLRARISFEGEEQSFWRSIRSLMDNETEDIEFANPRQFTVPWWVFLLKKRKIIDYMKHYRISPSIGEKAKEQLLKDREKEQNLEDAQNADIVSPEDVEAALNNANFSRILFPYQMENVQKLISLPSGATFSVPGAGKTTEALAYYAVKKRPGTKLLIVCPKNAFAVWEEEIENCFMGANPTSPVRLRGAEKIELCLKDEPEIMLTTYSQFQISRVQHLLADYLSRHETIMFLDESHHMKRGLDGIRGRSILAISHLPITKLILTGTPMPNHAVDLVSQFNFLYPHIDVDENDVIDNIQPVFVRTTKSDLNLPPKHEIPISISMSPSQERLYSIIRHESALELENLTSGSQIHIRSLRRCYIKLLRIASNPSLLLEDISDSHPGLLAQLIEEGDCPKLEYACRRARELAKEGKKTLIWSSFVSNVEVIAERLQDLGAVYIHGGVDAGSEEEEDSREWKINEFKNNPDCRVLVANPAAAGEGISLHKVCLNAIYIDRTFNAAHYLQSVDRIHRLGLEEGEEPLIEILISENTIDSDVHNRLVRKINDMMTALNDESIVPNPIQFENEIAIGEDMAIPDDMEGIIQHLEGTC